MSIRDIECLIIQDLQDRGASSRPIKLAHNVASRLDTIPEVKVKDGVVDGEPALNMIQMVLTAMRK
eukprot:5761124-Karenia_brevis.AAC.1